jgi:hypothetical protein
MSLWPKIVESAAGIYRGVLQHKPDAFNASYSDLDLYLMGLKPLSGVPMLKRLNNPDYSNPDSVRFTSITTVDPLTLPGRYGVRQPPYPDAQRNFSMATIVVKPLGWTDAEFAYFSLLARHAADTLDDGYGYNYNFEKAARGSGTLESKMFSPSGIPACPLLIAPADGASGQPTTVTLRWDSSLGATSYQIQISKKTDFTDTVSRKSGITGTSAFPSGLTNGATYYWRVCAVNAQGKSRFSAPRSFTLGSSTTVRMREGMTVRDFALMQSFPNPFNPMTTIPYDVPIRSRVIISIFNPLGQRIATPLSGEVEAGHHMIPFDGSGLASGVYYYRMEAIGLEGEEGQGFVQTKRFTLLK